MSWLRKLLLVMSAAVALACQKPAPAPAVRPARHVILVSIDTLRADRLGIYGYERDTSPHIDRFFADKSIYRNAQSSAPCTRPAVFELLSGSLIPDQQRIGSTGALRGSQATATLAETLREQGFRTAAITTNGNFSSGRHGRGYDLYVNLEHHLSPEQKQGTMYEVTERALSWLEEHRDESALHLWVHYFGPHRPFFPPDPLRRYSRASAADERLSDQDRKGETRSTLEAAPEAGAEAALASVMRRVPQVAGFSGHVAWHLRGDVFSPLQLTHLRDSYDDDIVFVDQQVGRLLDKLEELELVENSLIILTSDHGEWLGEENLWHHCNSLHRRELHVPLLVSLKGQPLSAAEPPAASSTLDILPTVLDVLAIDAPQPLDGVSLRAAETDRAVVSFWNGTFAVTGGRFKLYRGAFNGLFDLDADPDETRNLMGSHREEAEALNRALAGYLDDLPAFEDENRELIERLKSLGYL